ncbi:MAG: sigma 54-interacting transcriptional regulator [Eubacterium sp.]|nr:sigma 54-interacting transcriptional regulator [Eubacterium sp.]
MEKFDSKAIEILMNSMNQGLVYIDCNQQVRICNRSAKLFTGISIDSSSSHPSGVIEPGDIVIIADNQMGVDDGGLCLEDLELIGIKGKKINAGDIILAIGVYKTDGAKAHVKYTKNPHLDVPFELKLRYLGFDIETMVDLRRRITMIRVDKETFPIEYFSTVGNIVVIDGKSGKIKFYQAKGYSVRREDIHSLLNGAPFAAKSDAVTEPDVTGTNFLGLFNKSELTDKILEVLSGKEKLVSNKLYEINQRPFICNIIPWKNDDLDSGNGAFLVIQDAGRLETVLQDRNEVLRQLEESDKKREKGILKYPPNAFQNFIGLSSKSKEVKYMAYKASQNKFNVIIMGDSGTGKSKLAREIHKLGNPDAPFVEVNCNAIAHGLFESELFGYVGGAFTGAKAEGKIGFFEAANKGTIFLDEIGDIPLDIQVKLLHVLQNKMIYRVGSSVPINVDVRVIAATNCNLEEQVAEGKFRQDLFYRINVFPIIIPPLKERKEDLYPLIKEILEDVCKRYGLGEKTLSGGAMEKLLMYNWPGNVRELENCIERAVTICESDIIYSEHLKLGNQEIVKPLKQRLEMEEKLIIENVLSKHSGNKLEAMKELDVSRSVFYSKLKKYKLL